MRTRASASTYQPRPPCRGLLHRLSASAQFCSPKHLQNQPSRPVGSFPSARARQQPDHGRGCCDTGGGTVSSRDGRYGAQAMERPVRERGEATVPSPAASRGDQGGEAQTDAKVNLRAWTVDCSHKPIAYQTPVESSCSSGRSIRYQDEGAAGRGVTSCRGPETCVEV